MSSALSLFKAHKKTILMAGLTLATSGLLVLCHNNKHALTSQDSGEPACAHQPLKPWYE